MTTPYQPDPGYQPAAAEIPLSAPYYGASLPIAVRRAFAKYATFSGRASLSEYWWWVLAHFIVFIVLYILIFALGFAGADFSSGNAQPNLLFILPAVLLVIWVFGTIVPSLALVWRRLHDAGFSGAFYFLSFVPAGGIVVLIFTFLPSNPAGARFDYPGYGYAPVQYPPTQYPPTQPPVGS